LQENLRKLQDAQVLYGTLASRSMKVAG